MKVAILALAVAGMVVSAAPSWAGGACCAGKAKGEGKAAMSCMDATASLNLSDEQKAKITEIEASCKAAGATAEACTKSRDEIRALLTDEQKTEFDAACKKMSKKGASCHAPEGA